MPTVDSTAVHRLPSAAFWAGKQVLMTGHSGFIGAWAALWLERLGAEVLGLARAPDHEPNLYSLAGVAASVASQFLDVGDRSKVATLLGMAELDLVLHLAAQTSPSAARETPPRTFATNVMGTVNLLDCLRRQPRLKAVLVVTSEEVYATAEPLKPLAEDHPLGACDAVSASKAASELIAAGYRESHFHSAGVALATARGGAVIGGGDFARRGWPAPGLVRPWQHVLDSVAGYLVYLETLSDDPHAPRALNFGPAPSVPPTTAAAVAAAGGLTCAAGQILGQTSDQYDVPVRSVWLDTRLARDSLGFQSRLDPLESARWTAEWQRAVDSGVPARTAVLEQISAYETLA